MGKISRNKYNSETMKRDGGLVRCDKCGQITGFIHEGNHKYIKYIFVCKCGSVGKVEIIVDKKPKLEYPCRKIYQNGSVHICPNCERELFWVKEDMVSNYAFNVVCKCGVEYDMKYFIKRLD